MKSIRLMHNWYIFIWCLFSKQLKNRVHDLQAEAKKCAKVLLIYTLTKCWLGKIPFHCWRQSLWKAIFHFRKFMRDLFDIHIVYLAKSKRTQPQQLNLTTSKTIFHFFLLLFAHWMRMHFHLLFARMIMSWFLYIHETPLRFIQTRIGSIPKAHRTEHH